MSLSSGFKWIIVTATISSFLGFSTLAQAEYYIGCETPAYVCPTKHCVKKKHRVKHHKPRYHKKRCPSVTIKKVHPVVTACNRCMVPPPRDEGPCCAARYYNDGMMDASSMPYEYTQRVEYYDWTYYDYVHNDYDYNPDLSTGDDDNVIYPELQVNDNYYY